MTHTLRLDKDGHIDCPVFTEGREGAGAPCLQCGKCPRCCGCMEALAAKTGGTMGKVRKAKPEKWLCPRCGVEAEMELMHMAEEHGV